jgi:uncharacterized membrane protein
MADTSAVGSLGSLASEDTLGKLREQSDVNPGIDRLKEELQNYLQARTQHAVTGLGRKAGEAVTRLVEQRTGRGMSLGMLTKTGMASGKAALSTAFSQLTGPLREGVKGLFSKGRRGGAAKSMTIIEDIDVGVPVREAYDQWTQYQEFPNFAKGVVSVEKADDRTTSNWEVKVAKSTRGWKAKVTEQIPDERISWTSEGSKATTKGVVTFHPLGDNLTKVLLVLDYVPKGLVEKTGNLWRAQGRRARLDLKLYRESLMLRGEATGAWRGEIRDGEVVRDHDEATEREERDEEFYEDEDELQREEKEPYESEEEEEEEEEEPVEEELERPRPRARR